MADKLCAKEVEQFTAAFSIIDLDGGGSIELRELLTCAAEFGYDISLDELRSVVSLVDQDGSGSIEIDEFLEIMGLMLYRHTLESSDDEDGDEDEDDQTGAAGGGKQGGSSVGGLDAATEKAMMSGDVSFSSAASPEEKARAQQVMKARAKWASEAVQQLEQSLKSIEDAANAITAMLEGGGDSSGAAAFQLRKQQEAAQAQHRIAEASTARLVKRILLEAQSKGITPHQLPQIETLELEDDPAAAANAPIPGENGEDPSSTPSSPSSSPTTTNNRSGDNDDDENKNSATTVDPEALLRSLKALATQLKAAADALGANLVPMSMVKPQHTRGGARFLAAKDASRGAKKLAAGSSSASAGGNPRQHRARGNAGATKQKIQAQHEAREELERQKDRSLLLPTEFPGSKSKVNQQALSEQLAALSSYTFSGGSGAEDHEEVSDKKKSTSGSSGSGSQQKTEVVKGADDKEISAKRMALVSGGSSANFAMAGKGGVDFSSSKSKTMSAGENTQGGAGGSGLPSSTSDQLRAVAKQVLRSWAFPITPVCEQLDLLDERWVEFRNLLQGQEALTRPACPLGRSCPDRYNHQHRLQLTHPCYCRIDRYSGGSSFDTDAASADKKNFSDALRPLSEAALCPHMVRTVHGNCYTHLPPPEEPRGAGGVSASSSLLNNSPSSSPSASPSKQQQNEKKSKEARLSELITIVGRVDLTNIELGGVGSQAIAFVIAQDCEAQDNAAASGLGAVSYSVSTETSGTSSNQYKFKDLVLNKCCVSPAGAIALFKIAHHLRLLDLSNNTVGQKTVVASEEEREREKEKNTSSPTTTQQQQQSVVTSPTKSDKPPTRRSAGSPSSKKSSKSKKETSSSNNKNEKTSGGGGDDNKNNNNETSAEGGGTQQQTASSTSNAAVVPEEATSPPAVPSLMGTHIRELLLRNGNLTHLSLAGNRLTDSDGTGICEGIRQNVVLRVLDLTNNELGPRFGRELGYAMQDNQDIRCLRLGYNPLEATGTCAILEELKNSSNIEELDLTWTGLGPQGGMYLGEMINDCGSLARVMISHNNIQLNGMIAVGKSLANTQTLVHLDVSYNPVSEIGVIEVLGGLKTNTSLQTLNLTETSSSAQTLMKEIAVVTGERLAKLPPSTPQTNIIFGSGMNVPSHLVTADEPLKLSKPAKVASPGGKKGGGGNKRVGSASPSKSSARN